MEIIEKTRCRRGTFFTEGSSIVADDIDFLPSIGHPYLWFHTRSMPLSPVVDFFERKFILRRLEQAKNNIGKAAESLGMIKNNLYRKAFFVMLQCCQGLKKVPGIRATSKPPALPL